jgi:hypothetical protein
MNISRRIKVLLVAATFLVGLGLPAFASGGGEKPAASGAKMYIPVISKGF